jgi:hypothetical protein
VEGIDQASLNNDSKITLARPIQFAGRGLSGINCGQSM